MKYGIASYKRPNCRTVETLLKAGIEKSDICIAVQTKEDYEQYTKIHEGIEIIYEPKDCAAGNRNTLLDHTNSPIWLLDDDIISFGRHEGKSFRVNTKACLEDMEELARLAEKNGISILGLAPTGNSIIARSRSKYSHDCLLQGSVIFVNDLSIRFNENWKMVEDYELSLRVISTGGRIIRANRLTANKPQNGTNEGGLHDRYINGELPKWIRLLAKQYPQFKPNKTLTGGMLKRG